MKRSSGVIIVDAENVSKELFQYAFSYIKHRKFCTSSDLYIFGNKQNIPLKYYNKYTHATLINTYVGKNLADTYMCCFISKLLYENDDITTFFLIRLCSACFLNVPTDLEVYVSNFNVS